MQQADKRPSIVLGVRAAWGMRRFVIVLWLVGFVLFVPAAMILNGAGSSALAQMASGSVAPDGEISLLLVEAVAPVFAPLWIVIAVAMLLAWAFTVLWHGGVARFQVWVVGPPAPSRILGLGLTAWWPYCRLSLTALVVLISLMAAIWVPVFAGITAAFTSMAEERMVLFLAAGIVAAALVKIIIWAATLRGAWELAVPTRRSAVRAWGRGLAGVFRHPITTFSTLLVLGLVMCCFAVAPLIGPALWPVLRGGPAGGAFTVLAGLGVAFFSVALFTAFAPVSGLVGDPEAPSQDPERPA